MGPQECKGCPLFDVCTFTDSNSCLGLEGAAGDQVPAEAHDAPTDRED